MSPCAVICECPGPSWESWGHRSPVVLGRAAGPGGAQLQEGPKMGLRQDLKTWDTGGDPVWCQQCGAGSVCRCVALGGARELLKAL